jgi:phage baseplate assembly protein W
MLRNVEWSKHIHKWYACRYYEPRHDIELALVTFDSTSHGHLAMVIYEWKDYQYLGKVTSVTEDLPVSIVLCE